MSARPNQRGLSAQDLEAILAVTSKLAAPFDLHTMLTEVMSAAKQVLGAEGGSVWLYDASTDELLLEVADAGRHVGRHAIELRRRADDAAFVDDGAEDG